MTKKNETPVLILSLLITLALLGAGVWWFANRLNPGGWFTTPEIFGTDSAPSGNAGPLSNRLSLGERSLIPGASAEKQAGIEAIAAGNYAQAVTNLEAALRANRNDPEALIYLNNARIADQTAYTIAVSVPAAAAVDPAQEILRGVAQAQNEVNQAGGINGVPLRVKVASDDNTPATTQQIARAFVDDPSVLGVVGHFGSEASLSAGQVYQQAGVVMISPTSTSTQLAGVGDFVFRTVPSDRFTAAALSRYMVNTLQQQNAVVFFNSGSDYSRSLKDEFTTALLSDGGQVLAEVDLSSSTFNAQQAIAQAQQRGATVLVLVPNTATLDQALQVVAVNRRQLQVLGGDSVYNPRTLQVGGEAAVGMAVAVPWHVLSDSQNAFVQTSRQLWGGDVNWRTATAYDATQALIAGLRTAPTRQGLLQALSAADFSVAGATGTVRFLPSGDRNQAAQIVEVEPGTRSGFGYDFVPNR